MSKLISLNLSAPPETRGNPFESPSVGLGNIGAIWSWLSGSETSWSGESTDAETVLKISTVYSCVRLIAETAASMPLTLFERMPKGRREAVDSDLYDILTVAPNPEMNAVCFWTNVVGTLALTGNSFVLIQRSLSGAPIALWPLMRTRPIRLPNKELAFETIEGDHKKIYPASDVLAFKTFSQDGGITGLSPIHLASQTLGLARAQERAASLLMKHGGRPSGIMNPIGQLDPKTMQTVKESWQNNQNGNGSTAFIPGDWKYTAIGLDMQQMDLINSRAFTRSEICGLWRIPPHMVGDLSKSSQHTSEQESLSLITLTLNPYLRNIENECLRVLLPKIGRNANKFFVEFDVTSLTRGDFATTMAGLSLGRQWGFYSGNQILEKLGENPIGPVGDVYWVPVNYANAETLLAKPEPVAPPTDATPVPAIAPGPTEAPKNDLVPTDSERSLMAQYSSAFMLTFRDSFGRLAARDTKDISGVSTCFEPLLRSITNLVEDNAALKMDLPEAWNPPTDRFVKDAVKLIDKRCSTWTTANADQVAGPEFVRVLRSIVANVFHEAAAATITGPLLLTESPSVL